MAATGPSIQSVLAMGMLYSHVGDTMGKYQRVGRDHAGLTIPREERAKRKKKRKAAKASRKRNRR